MYIQENLGFNVVVSRFFSKIIHDHHAGAAPRCLVIGLEKYLDAAPALKKKSRSRYIRRGGGGGGLRHIFF